MAGEDMNLYTQRKLPCLAAVAAKTKIMRGASKATFALFNKIIQGV